MELLKRHLWDIYPELLGVNANKRSIPSVSNIAVTWFYATLLAIIKAAKELNVNINKILEKLYRITKSELLNEIIKEEKTFFRK